MILFSNKHDNFLDNRGEFIGIGDEVLTNVKLIDRGI
jgi:hypothetical protein